MPARRVVITGLGMITAAGIGAEPSWLAVVRGESGVSGLAAFDASTFPSRIAAEVRGFQPEAYIEDKRIIGRLGKGDDYGLAAARMAVDDAGLTPENTDFNRGGIYVGCGKEIGTPSALFPAIEVSLNDAGNVDRRKFGVEAMRQTYPLFLVKDLPNAILFYISKLYKLPGINANIVAGGTASSQAIGDACRAIQRGESDFVIAGGFDARVEPINVSFLCSAGLLSSRNDEPKEACAPFDAGRDGFAVGEGAAILVLEELEHALARQAGIYAELAGYAATADPGVVTGQENIGDGVARAISGALRDAGIPPSEIDYVNADGDGTPAGDRAETASIKAALAGAAYRVPVSSVKPVIGHLMTASGAAELILTVMAMRDGQAPPTINYRNPDPSCDLDYVPNRARDVEIGTALSINKCALSGRNTAIIIRKYG